MSKNNNVGRLSFSTTVVTRFFSLCAVLLVLPAVEAAQFLPPGWYRNSGPSTFYQGEHLTITWENSYIYPYPAGVPLYWYAHVKYRIIGSEPFKISCNENPDPSTVKEHIRDKAGGYLGYVPAEDSFCTRHPGWTNTYMPGETFEDWVIFHNVPWAGLGEKGEISLEWGAPYGSSAWVEPWHTPFNAAPPAVCPHELETLGTCKPGEEKDNLPYPSWWNGAVCDTQKIPNSAPLGAYYRGVPACGPIDLPTDNSTLVTFPGGWGEWEWQCVELSMRFMWLAYGIEAYDANGNEVVDHYTDPQRNPANYNNPILVRVTNDGSSRTAPQPGDVLSYIAGDVGHTSVVAASSVDSNGNGTIWVIEQNIQNDPTGTTTLNVQNWVVQSGVKNWLHHTVDLSRQSGSPLTNVTVSGTGFGANEIVIISFDTTREGIAMADSKGAFSITITIPGSATRGSHDIQSIGRTSGFSPTTVFYVR